MKKAYSFYLLFLINFVVSDLIAQLSINPVPISNELPSNSVQRFFQDKEGFIWLGTLDGLCRYDGYRLLTFRSNTKKPNLLTNNEITSIAEDTRNNLWIGTSKGLNILDKRTYKIRHLDIPELNNAIIRAITLAADSTIWIGTDRQVIRFNSDFSIKKKYDSSLPISGVNSIYQDYDGNIWITLWQNGMYSYDNEEDTFVRLPDIGLANNPFRIFQDKDKNTWIATWGDGIYLLNKEKNGDFLYEKIIVENQTSAVGENCFFSIAQDDKNGYLWFISTSRLYAFEITESKTLRNIDISPLLEKTSNIFSEITKDKRGNLWINTFGDGVLIINFEKPLVQNYPMSFIKSETGLNPYITVIYEDNHNNIWFSQNRYGLGVFNEKENNTFLFFNIPEINKLSRLGFVNCISGFRAIPEEVWIAVSDIPIIYSMKKENRKIRLNYTIDLREIDSKEWSDVKFFFEDRKNNIWIVTSNSVYIRFYNKEEIERVDLSLNNIGGITEDTKGNIWLSSLSDGVSRIYMMGNQTDKLQVIHYHKGNSSLVSNNIETICGDTNGYIWIGSKEGNVLIYDVSSETFTELLDFQKMINEAILNIIADEYGHIWITTKKRIIEYNPTNRASREYTTNDGVLINSFYKNSYYKSKSGKLFFGGNNGISIFTPSEKLAESNGNIKVFITDVKINNKSVFSNHTNDHFDVVSQTIHLNSNDKNIEINFSSLNYAFSNKIRYAYKVDGLNDDWVYAEDNRQFATYNQLKKGTHIFHLKATDENGLWSSDEIQLKIYKRPAYYETWWAYILYLILFVSAAYYIYRIVKKRIRLRNELKIAKIEKEKSEELTQSKLHYFTNISHDFMTPLTIISCLIDDAEMTNKEKIKQFEGVRSNIQRLRRLLQQVLDFRKMESGNMKLKLSYGDIVMFIKDICTIHFEPLMQKKNIKFTFSTTHDQVYAFFDPDKIDKVIFNLLSNAYKYVSENGNITVELELHDERMFIIRISDTGIGISKKDQQRIFIRFYTDDQGRAKDSNGIGLSLTKELVELHHGTISVESDIGKGAVFTVQVPIDRDSYSVMEINNSKLLNAIERNLNITSLDGQKKMQDGENSSTEKSENKKVNLLLVEDNEELLNVVSNVLSKYYNMFTATNGLKALTIIKEKDIDIVVSDVMMPEMDGLELCKQIKNDINISHIPVILLTAKSSDESKLSGYEAGADEYVSKPFNFDILLVQIKKLIKQQEDRRFRFRKSVDVQPNDLTITSLDEKLLQNALQSIEKNISNTEYSIDDLSADVGLGRTSLYQKIQSITGETPALFIRSIRLKRAAQLLRDTDLNVSEIADLVGFGTIKYFNKYFKEEFDDTPTIYRQNQQNS